MASKRFKGKLCVYCAEKPSITGDHVFCREFFLPEHRAELPQAPTCDSCNNQKSTLEHYLTALLPFGGRHTSAKENLALQVPKRLQRNQKLYRQLSAGRCKVDLVEGQRRDSTIALPIKEGAIEALLCQIVKGLAWHHWGVYLSQDCMVEATSLTIEGQKFYQENFFSMRSKNRVLESLGNDTIIYEGIQGIDCPEITIWRFHLYGGMLMADETGLTSTQFGAMSGPERVMNQ